MRDKCGPIPVVFLNQQVEIYPKLHGRMEFYELGRLVSESVKNCYFGGVLSREELELADIGSCGANLTLHYTGPTYRKMLNRIPMFTEACSTARANISNHVAAPPLHPDKPPDIEVSFHKVSEPPYSREAMFAMFQRYFIIPEADSFQPKCVPAVIELGEQFDYCQWVRTTK